MWKRLNAIEKFSTEIGPTNFLDLKARILQEVGKQSLNVSVFITVPNKLPQETMFRVMLPDTEIKIQIQILVTSC